MQIYKELPNFPECQGGWYFKRNSVGIALTLLALVSDNIWGMALLHLTAKATPVR